MDEIPNTIEEILKNEESSQKEQIDELDDKLSKKRDEWTNKIKDMGKKLKSLQDANDLLTDIYTERQLAVEYYHYLIAVFSKINKKYYKEWSDRYDFYTYQSNKRFPNEKQKTIQIMSDLGEIVIKRELLENHLKFMDKSIDSIDGIKFGIGYKIEIEKLSKGK